jgi:hypothetical protein
MINPVSGSNAASYAEQAASPVAKQPPAPKSTSAQFQDTVHLSSTGDVDHDGDSR